ncbi:hypothetical protein ACM1ZW_19550 [Pseudomonas sp. NFX71]|uniref:Uncharacterized protein n=1 Tax=Pseudomonas migulae TaxID=78543 RepID=A0ABY8N2V5_9PSED|nr:hypothetical protein [Pseudomonas migulae]WGK92562.1 hypothetical protein MOQ58_10375 [Pseudomonas migulae]
MSDSFDETRALFIEKAKEFGAEPDEVIFGGDDFVSMQNHIVGVLASISAVGLSRKVKSVESLFDLAADLGAVVLGPLLQLQNYFDNTSNKCMAEQKALTELLFNISHLFFIPSGNLRNRYRVESSAFNSSLGFVNELKEAIRERAQTIADEKWKSDAKKKEYPRVSDMALYVKGRLESEGWSDDLPKTIETIKGWLRPVAPAYAKQPGRSPKSS